MINSTQELNLDGAHSGRIHSVLLEGKDAYSADYAASASLASKAKRFQVASRATRLWLLRAVQYLAGEEGVEQFVELGSGYPCEPNVHDVAGECRPSARILYVDHDPVVAAHGRALLADDRTFFAHADLADADTIVSEMARVLDLTVPVAICLSFVAEFIADPVEVIDVVTAALPAGSFVALSHVTSDVDARVVESAIEVYASYGIDFRPRGREAISCMLSRCDLVEPGLVEPHRWRPASEIDRRRARRRSWEPDLEESLCCYAAVGKLR